jgi:hypothetical protein
MTGIIIMGIGSVVFAAGLVVFTSAKRPETAVEKQKRMDHVVELAIADGVLTKNELAKIKELAEESGMDAANVIQDAEQKMAERGIESETELVNYAKKSGDDFEKYVVQNFSKKYYKLKEWAGDKYVKGVYAETTQNPDLLMELTTQPESHLFSVECKWRKEFHNDFIQFAKEAQLKRYKKYEKDNGIPVFIALGVGGTPSKPAQLFVIPLRYLKKINVHKDQLEGYQQDVDAEFYYDHEKQLFK